MNILMAVNYGRSQSLQLDTPALTGWNWSFNIDYLF
jgi:hypothetical protein